MGLLGLVSVNSLCAESPQSLAGTACTTPGVWNRQLGINVLIIIKNWFGLKFYFLWGFFQSNPI